MDTDTASMHTAQAGQKRKQPHTPAKTPSKPFPNSFCVPSPTSSDDDDDDDDDDDNDDDEMEHVEEFKVQRGLSVSKRPPNPIKYNHIGFADIPEAADGAPEKPFDFLAAARDPDWYLRGFMKDWQNDPTSFAYKSAVARGELTPIEDRQPRVADREPNVADEDPNNGRVPRYTGSIASQPPAVQANIDEGLAPLAPRSTNASHIADDNVFTATTETEDKPLFPASEPKARPKYDPWAAHDPNRPRKKASDFHKAIRGDTGGIKGWFERHPEAVKKPTTTTRDAVNGKDETSATSRKLDSSTPRDTLTATQATVKENTTQTSSQGSGPLASKKWDQTPPPKPQPRNAELPQQQAPKDQALEDPMKPQTPQEQALRANALKYAPIRPSGLRQMTQMSPLQQQIEDKENAKGKEREKMSPVTSVVPNFTWDATLFSKEVNDAIMAIPEEKIVPMELPAHLFQGWGQQSVVEKEVDKLFQQ
jgi:hypothetical protein